MEPLYSTEIIVKERQVMFKQRIIEHSFTYRTLFTMKW